MPNLLSHPTKPAATLRLASLAAVGLLALGLALPQPAEAKKQKNHPTATSKAGKGSAKATYRSSPSEETRPERERRLLRECRGLPDAGACRGYTRR